MHAMLDIYIDADACPVKEETYRVAKRYDLRVLVVSNAGMRVPTAEWVEAVVLPGAGSTVDDWIAEHVDTGDIVVTADIPLAERCLRRGACVIGPKGHAFTEDSIGEALGMRSLMEELRQTGAVTGGPGPMTKQDRSRFLSRLDETINAIRRTRPK
jgi:uncharacterized protein YaiI (UPF0178 family)